MTRQDTRRERSEPWCSFTYTCALLVCLSLTGAGLTQAGEIRGSVVSPQRNGPVPSVEVSLASNKFSGGSPAVQRNMRTGLDGRFGFIDVPPGDYSLIFRKDGYEAGSSVSASVSIDEGEQPRADLHIEMRRSAAISGLVLDADGDPVPLATVQLFERLTSEGLSRLQVKGGGSTDDLGEYRASGLSPGRYFVTVLPLSLRSPRGVRAFEFPNVYYPNAGSIEESEPIAVTWGTERDGIDFDLPRAIRTSVEGAVIHGETGQPCPACNVTVLGAGNVTVASVSPDEQGFFAVRGLHPGEYRLLAQTTGGGFHAEETALLVSRKTVEVVLATSPTQDVMGRIVADNAPPEDDTEALTKAMRVRLMSEVGAPSGRLAREPTLAEGGGFHFSNVTPGSHHVFVQNLPKSAYVRQMLLDGHLLKTRRIQVPRETPIERLEIRLAFDAGVVKGSVDDDAALGSGTPPGFVVLLPDRYGEGWQFERLGRYRPEDGAYEIPGVPPGSYAVFAIPADNHFDLGIPEDLSYLRQRGRRVRVTAGESVTADAPYILDRE